MKRNFYIAELLANRLDNTFNILGIRFGLSAFIDLIPGFGDILDMLLACYIVWLAIQMQVPGLKIAQMLWNILFSFLIGLLPIVGDAAYIFYKPNVRNLKILKHYQHILSEGVVIQ